MSDRTEELVLAMALPNGSPSASKARAAVVGAFAGLPEEVLDDAQLLVSEAVSMAIRTSSVGSDVPIRLTGFLRGGVARVEVRHAGSDLGSASDDLTARVLEAVATDWGAVADDRASTLWFELAVG